MDKINRYYIDVIVIGVMLILTVVRDVTVMLALSQAILWIGLVLVILYMFTYRWINKPAVSSQRNNVFNVLYGIALSLLAAGVLLDLIYRPGATLGFWGLILAIVLVIVDATLSAFTKVLVVNKATAIRLIVLVCITLAAWRVIPIEKRFLYTYRNNADFIEFYETRKAEYSFWQIHFLYEKEHGPL